MSARSLALVALLLVACTTDDGGNDVDVHEDTSVDLPAMLPGSVVLHAARQDYGDPDPVAGALGASVDGPRVVVLTQRPWRGSELDTGHATLHVSEDGGATFRVVAITDEPALTMPRAVYAARDRVFVVESSVTGSTQPLSYRAGALREVNLASGARGVPIAFPMLYPSRYHRDADAIASFRINGGTLEWARFEVASGAVQRVSRPLTDDEACMQDRLDGRVPVTSDGVRYMMLCQERFERCLVTFDGGTGGATTRTCVPLAAWPIGAHVAHAIIARADGVYLLYTAASHVVARRFDANALGEVVDLGPGMLGPYASVNEDNRGGLLRAFDARGAARLVAWPEGGVPRTLPLAPSACRDGSACSTSPNVLASYLNVAIIAPLDPTRERWLAIYPFNWSGDTASYFIVARALQAGDVGPDFEPPPADLADIGPPPPEAAAESALERACSRALTCFPTFGMEDCVEHWLVARGATAVADEAYQAFVATGPECSDFIATFPQVALRNPECLAVCSGDAAFFGCAPEPLSAGASCDGPCTLDADGFASCGTEDLAACNTCVGVRAVHCRAGRFEDVTDCAAAGLPCVDSAAGPVCASGQTCSRNACGIGGLEICAVTLSGPRVVATLDCARAGLLCDTGFTLGAGGHCGTMLRQYATCVTGTGSRCDGDALLYCVGGQQRMVDCAGEGRRCESHATAIQAEAHCAAHE